MAVGCGGSGDSATPTTTRTQLAQTVPQSPAPAGPTVPAEDRLRVLNALASRPQDMTGTARYAIRTYAVGPANHPLVTSVEGLADFDHERYSAEVFHFDPSNGASRGPSEFFVAADVIYEHVAIGWVPGTKPPQEIGSPLPLPPLLGYIHNHGVAVYAYDRAARRTLVEGLVSRIELVGTEGLRGTEADHFRVHFDALQAEATVPRPLVDEMNRWSESPGTGYLDLWLEGELLRQFTSVTKPYEEAWLRLEQEYWDYGEVEPLPVPSGLPAGRPR